MSPAGLSPSYPQSEPSPDPLGGAQPGYIPQTAATRRLGPSTMMGQLMGALNNPTIIDDLNLNIETMHGGFDCNVDEIIKHEMSVDGTLDFNFTHSQVCSSFFFFFNYLHNPLKSIKWIYHVLNSVFKLYQIMRYFWK